jgi:hypothetical protein
MVEKYKLSLTVALVTLLVVIWLIWAKYVWDFVGYLLLASVFIFIAWTLVRREKRQANLLGFFVKSLVICYILTSIIWFVWLSLTSPGFYANLDLRRLIDTMVLSVLPLSLFPVAISVIVCGILRIKLKAWEIFLSSWYISIFLVFTIYQVWWSLYARPYLPDFYYSSIAGAIAVVLGLASLSFLFAGIITIVYIMLKKQT